MLSNLVEQELTSWSIETARTRIERGLLASLFQPGEPLSHRELYSSRGSLFHGRLSLSRVPLARSQRPPLRLYDQRGLLALTLHEHGQLMRRQDLDQLEQLALASTLLATMRQHELKFQLVLGHAPLGRLVATSRARSYVTLETRERLVLSTQTLASRVASPMTLDRDHFVVDFLKKTKTRKIRFN